MTVAATGDLVADAHAHARGLAAFNVITIEHAEGIVAGAEDVGGAVILQISQNAVRYHDGALAPLAAACRAIAASSDVPVALHLDHVTDERLLAEPALRYFSSVMFDAGALAYAENVATTRRAVALAHEDGLWVEAELGFVGGKPDAPLSAHAAGVRTDPAEARAFVLATGVDALAVAVGSSHAMTQRTASIDADLVAAIAAVVPAPLVLHGSSGVMPDELQRGIVAGLTKINIGTALNVAMTAAVRESLAETAVVDPRAYLGAGRAAVRTTVAELLRTVGGHAEVTTAKSDGHGRLVQ